MAQAPLTIPKLMSRAARHRLMHLRNRRRHEGGWVQLVLFIATTLVSIALAPKPPKPKPASLADFDFPTADADRPIPVVFGEVEITGPNVHWYGDLSKSKIKKKAGFKKATIGWKYYLGWHAILCYGPVDAVNRCKVDDKVAGTFNLTASGTTTIHQPELFGEAKAEGGVSGTLRFMFGESTQVAPDYMLNKIANPQPGYRNVLSVLFTNRTQTHPWTGEVTQAAETGGGYMGNSQSIRPWAFRVLRRSAGWHGGTAWYAAKIAPTTKGMNAAHIIYQCLTDPEWGMGVPASALGDAAFTACADTLYDEGMGLQLLWNSSTSIEDFIMEVAEHIGAVFGLNPSTGKLELKLIRGDYDPSTLPVFDITNIKSMQSFQRQVWGETVNEIVCTYTDPDTYKGVPVVVQDIANILAQGAVVSNAIQLPGFHSRTLAQDAAMRELQARSTPLAKIRMTVNRAAWAEVSGDCIKINWPPRGVEGLILRILDVKKGPPGDSAIDVEGVEDIFSVSAPVYTSVPDNDPDPSVPPSPPEPEESNNSVVSTTTTAPPAEPDEDETYFVPAGATGAWAGHEGQIATWDMDTMSWVFETVAGAVMAFDENAGEQRQLNPDGTTSSPAWTPAVPPLTEDAAPDPSKYMLPGFQTDLAAYRKVKASNLFPVAVSVPVGGFIPGAPSASEVLLRYVIPQNGWSLPLNFSGFHAHIGTNPTASYAMTVAKNGSSIGTVTFDTSGVATGSSGGTTFNAGDVLTITAPGSTDSTAADVSIALALSAAAAVTLEPNLIAVSLFFAATPGSNELIGKYVATRAFSFPGNFAGSAGSVGTNPASTFTATVALNGANIGTIQVSTGGVFSFTTDAGAAIPVLVGDVLEYIAPSSADASIANIAVTLAGSLS